MAQLDPTRPTIPGIDDSQLQDRLGDDAGLTRQVLTHFARTQRAAADDLHSMLDHDPRGARARAHDLKGMLGNIAAVQLYSAARELEAALLRDDRTAALRSIASLRTDLPALCDAIDTALAQPQAGAEESPPLDAAAIAERLEALRHCLRSGRAREARRLVEELQAPGPNADQRALIERIAALVRSYRLRDALATLETGAHG
jgi:HPt (histidine-containing phosphotransfer) domain-containing protein